MERHKDNFLTVAIHLLYDEYRISLGVYGFKRRRSIYCWVVQGVARSCCGERGRCREARPQWSLGVMANRDRWSKRLLRGTMGDVLAAALGFWQWLVGMRGRYNN
ncbi:hypothetical protein H0E87_004930 [Populus deltoides]|uniref:Uncharacterized protein n=1 Tax=Populus deltoides TaxID=3696 RepID=A0A8T2ZHK2_POPDE|nr:hypothetical protein H0E87_004930 [Populus deltoides]